MKQKDNWCRKGLFHLGMIVLGLFIYIMSFGPVVYWCGSKRTIPVFYKPLTTLIRDHLTPVDDGTAVDLYRAYLNWWFNMSED